jgi:hypothetical protein
MSRVQSGVVLQQSARRVAQARARELVQRADSDLRPLDVQEASRSRRQVSSVQGGDVLQQEAQGKALGGAREQVRGAARIQIVGWILDLQIYCRKTIRGEAEMMNGKRKKKAL